MKSINHSLYNDALRFADIFLGKINACDRWDLGLLAYYLCFKTNPFEFTTDINNIRKLIISHSEGLQDAIELVAYYLSVYLKLKAIDLESKDTDIIKFNSNLSLLPVKLK